MKLCLLCATLILAAPIEARAQESRGTPLRVPPARTPVVADAAMRHDAAAVPDSANDLTPGVDGKAIW